ncbi:hypothetical protein V6N11_019872 [Hibiscus sabdariffa]|uniref:Uncharacterized protein n=2 Tax=Hibiscus sabdariffa TaxID=183260 RepID=A0ABR2NB02_9ROSI
MLMDIDWDLHAVVRDCAFITTTTRYDLGVAANTPKIFTNQFSEEFITSSESSAQGYKQFRAEQYLELGTNTKNSTGGSSR